jgi:hypothetical protein
MYRAFSSSYVKQALLAATASVAVLAVAPTGIAGPQGPNANPNPSSVNPMMQTPIEQAIPSPRLPDGFIEKDENAASGVKATLVGLTQRAVTKDSYNSFFSSFLSELDKRDKTRAQEFTGADQNQLNATISQIQSEWRNKYNQDFEVSDKNLVFGDQYPIAQGEVSDPAMAAASAWPVATPGVATNAGAGTEQQQCNTRELTSGRPVAVMGLPARDGLPIIYVSLIHQTLSGWYVAIPADRTGEQIYRDLSSQLR